MIGIAICTHSDFADGLLHASEMVAGKQEQFVALGFDGNEQLLDYGERIKNSTEGFKDGCVYVCDLQNATPFNASLLAIANTDNVVLSGACLPMMMELLITRQTFEGSPKELANMILESCSEYVHVTTSDDVFKGGE